MERVILHSDANCFYASVEMLYHPEYAGKPLAVGGDPEARHGIVLTANYIAKRSGVKTGMALWQAKQVCPDLIFVPPRMDLYLKFSFMLREIYSEYVESGRTACTAYLCQEVIMLICIADSEYFNIALKAYINEPNSKPLDIKEILCYPFSGQSEMFGNAANLLI